jgi:hypothetical protein
MAPTIIIHMHVKSIFYKLQLKYYLTYCLSDSFTTTSAPWNVTQWVDPYDPYPKIVTMPIILVIRK